MNPPKVSIVDMEGLTELLNEVFQRPATQEEVERRFGRACRLAYTVVRNEMSRDECSMSTLANKSSANMFGNDKISGAAGAVILEAMGEFLDMKRKQDLDRFTIEFILALDRAVESTGRHLEESYDTGTEQSTSQRSNQPLTTP